MCKRHRSHFGSLWPIQQCPAPCRTKQDFAKEEQEVEIGVPRYGLNASAKIHANASSILLHDAELIIQVDRDMLRIGKGMCTHADTATEKPKHEFKTCGGTRQKQPNTK